MDSTGIPQRGSSPICPRGTFLAQVGPWAIAGHSWCKSWRCERCARKKAARLAARIANCEATKLLTLTMRPIPGASQVEHLDQLNSRFRDLMKRLRRAHPKSVIKYVKVVELHKSGIPHLHVAMQAPYIPQAVISRVWRSLIGAPIVDIRRIKKSAGAAKYLAKYLTKSDDQIAGRRRWSASPAFLPELEDHRSPVAQLMERWYHTGAPLESVTAMLAQQGYVRITEEEWLFEPGAHRYPLGP